MVLRASWPDIYSLKLVEISFQPRVSSIFENAPGIIQNMHSLTRGCRILSDLYVKSVDCNSNLYFAAFFSNVATTEKRVSGGRSM